MGEGVSTIRNVSRSERGSVRIESKNTSFQASKKVVDDKALKKAFGTIQSLTSRNKHTEADRALSKFLGYDDITSQYDKVIKQEKINPNNGWARNKSGELFSEMYDRVRRDYDNESAEKIIDKISNLR